MKGCLWILKFFALLFLGFTAIVFIMIVIFAFIAIWHLPYGILFFFGFLLFLGILAIIYVFIEIIYKFIFEIKQKPQKIFIIFMTGLVLIGFGFASSFLTILNYNFEDIKMEVKTLTEEYLINDNDYFYFNLPANNTEYVFEDIDSLKLEIIYPKCANYKIKNHIFNSGGIIYNNYYGDYIVNPEKLYKNILNDLKQKKITNWEFVNIKIHISKDNYDNLVKNNKIRF